MPYLPKIHIHLIAFDRKVYGEIKFIAVRLMTSSKTCAAELKMISLVTRYALPSYQSLQQLNHLYLFWVNPPS